MELMRLGVAQVAGNQSAEATASYIKQPESTLQQLVSTPYDQVRACARVPVPLLMKHVPPAQHSQRAQLCLRQPCWLHCMRSRYALPLLRHLPRLCQYEVAIPVATMAACMAKVLDTVYGGDLMGEDKAKR